MGIATGLTMESIDRGTTLVRKLPGWVGVLWLSALPCRLLSVWMISEMWRYKDEVRSHGEALLSLAELVLAAWLVALIGRQFFVRACRIAHDSAQPTLAAVIRLPWRELMATLYAALILEVLFWVLLPFAIVSPLILLVGLASAAISQQGGIGIIAPLRALGGIQLSALLCLGAILLLATIVVLINAYVVIQAVLWLFTGIAGLDLSSWKPLLNLGNHTFLLLLGAAGTLLVEPFALAAVTVLAILSQARRTGDDLVEWFGILRTQAKP